MIPSNEQIATMLTAPGQMFEIEQCSIRGLPLRTWKHAPLSLRHVIESSLGFNDRTYIVYEGERLTFAEHYRQVTAVAVRLVQEFGIRPGDRVAIAMRNFPEWSVAFWATVSVGAIAVPLNAWWAADELMYGLADSGAKLLFADQERVDRLVGKLAPLGLSGVIVARAAGLTAPFTDIEALLASAPREVALPPASIDPDDDATIFYTSGTTGLPKGALGTHRNICTMVNTFGFFGARAVLRAGGTLQDLAQLRQVQQTALLTVPLFHVTGCHGVLLTALAAGGKIVMMYKWDAQRALELIERESVTVLNTIPTMVWQLLDDHERAPRNLSSLRSIGYGGAPAPPELRRRVSVAIPAALPGAGYGITECSAAISGAYGRDYADHADSAGLPIPICEVIAVDEDGREVARGELGELCVRGPNVVKGYWNNQEATQQAFGDGWFHTGDIGKLDAENFLYVVDRKKDMIIRGGENVYCAEVEAVLLEDRRVKSAAVIGIPHQVLGEEVGAVVQIDPAHPISEDELREHARGRLAAYKVPTRLWLRTEPLPLGATGKILKRELREQVLAGSGRQS